MGMQLEGWMRVSDAAQELGVTARRVRALIGLGVLAAEQLTPRMYLDQRDSVELYKRDRRPAGRPRRATPSGSILPAAK
jgi:hypothetical protein